MHFFRVLVTIAGIGLALFVAPVLIFLIFAM